MSAWANPSELFAEIDAEREARPVGPRRVLEPAQPLPRVWSWFDKPYTALSPEERQEYRRRLRVLDPYALTPTEAESYWDGEWMSHEELTEAVPPAYTEFVGAALLAACDLGDASEGQSRARR